MHKETPMTIRVLTEADLAEAMPLIARANWNQTERDWLRLIRLEPQGCFAARLQGRLAATITTTLYGTALAWIGMMFVAPAYRRCGIATRLMGLAMAYVRARGVATVKLDATKAGRPVYEALGFVSEGLIERWEAVAQPCKSGPLSPLAGDLWPALCAFDRKAFKADRTRLLATLLRDCCAPPLAFTTPDGGLQGYALARQGAAARYIGPVVATDTQTALALLDGMISQLAGETLYVDCPTGCGIESEALLQRGFAKQRDLRRMRYGKANNAGSSTMVYAIAGPEVG